MHVDYVPLLPELRRLYDMPRDKKRFVSYMHTMMGDSANEPKYPPLVLVNPMARDHLRDYVATLISIDADRIARETLADLAVEFEGCDDRFDGSLVVLDDVGGGWTNRYSTELYLRMIPSPRSLSPRQRQRFWVTGVLWSSEQPDEAAVRTAIRSAALRVIHVTEHGHANTLEKLLRQEGWVMRMSGCSLIPLEQSDFEDTRETLALLAESDDMGTLIECLFGDEAAATLGFSGQGLVSWAGLRYALQVADNDNARNR